MKSKSNKITNIDKEFLRENNTYGKNNNVSYRILINGYVLDINFERKKKSWYWNFWYERELESKFQSYTMKIDGHPAVGIAAKLDDALNEINMILKKMKVRNQYA